eukprot:IDg236t1
MVVRSKEKAFYEFLLQFFAAPDIPKSVLEHCRFKKLINAANPLLKLPTVKTLNSRLWSKFNNAILGCMVSNRCKFSLETKTVGNFRLAGRHTAADICNVLKSVIQKRLGGRKPTYFVSDSAPANKAAVRMLMQNDGGDDHCTGPTGDVDAIDWDELDDEGLIHQVDMLSTTSAYKRLTHTARAIRATLRRSHRRMQTFITLQ